MAEKRKMSFSITFRIGNMKMLIEAFHKSKWDDKFNMNILHYRFRVNGKWLDITHSIKNFLWDGIVAYVAHKRTEPPLKELQTQKYKQAIKELILR